MRLWHQAPRGLHLAAEAQAVAAVYSRVKEELKGKKAGNEGTKFELNVDKTNALD